MNLDACFDNKVDWVEGRKGGRGLFSDFLSFKYMFMKLGQVPLLIQKWLA